MEATALQTTKFDVAKVQDVIGNAPAVYERNQVSRTKAKEMLDALLKDHFRSGMSDPLDVLFATYIEKAKTTKKQMNERRKPFTQMVDVLKKEFTGMEGELDECITLAQTKRDEYATKKMQEQRERERQAQLKLEKEREVITLGGDATIKINDAFIEHLNEAKQLMLDTFNNATLENIETVFIEIGTWGEELTKETYRTFKPVLRAVHHSQEEIATIISNVCKTTYPENCKKYQESIKALKIELSDKFQSKQKELVELQKAGEEEKKRLLEEQQRREAEEKKRLEAEAEAARQKAAAETNVQTSAEIASATVNTQAEIGFEAKSEVKEGFKININNVAGNLPIVQLWYENEGKKLPQEKIDKMTFERMRKFCEKWAMDTGEFISSEFIEYQEIYKAK